MQSVSVRSHPGQNSLYTSLSIERWRARASLSTHQTSPRRIRFPFRMRTRSFTETTQSPRKLPHFCNFPKRALSLFGISSVSCGASSSLKRHFCWRYAHRSHLKGLSWCMILGLGSMMRPFIVLAVKRTFMRFGILSGRFLKRPGRRNKELSTSSMHFYG